MSESKFDEYLRLLQDAVRRQDEIPPEEAEMLHRVREELLAEQQDSYSATHDDEPGPCTPTVSPASSYARRLMHRARGEVSHQLRTAC